MSEGDGMVRIFVDKDYVVAGKRNCLEERAAYFRALFSFQGQKPCDKVIFSEEGSLSRSALVYIIEGLETGDFTSRLNESNYKDLISASAYLQCEEAEAAIANFVLNRVLNTINAFNLYYTSLSLGSVHLERIVKEYIEDQINNNISVPELLRLSREELEQHLETVVNNFVAFLTVCCWASANLESRGGSVLDSLLSDTIFELIPSAEMVLIEGIEEEPVIVKGYKITEYYDNLSLADKIKYWRSPERNIPEKRWPMCVLICSLGSRDNWSINFRDFAEKKWIKLTSKPPQFFPSSYGMNITVVQGKYLYFIAGDHETIWTYDIHADAWKKLSVKKEPRLRAGVCTVGKKIYIFGGYISKGVNRQSHHNSDKIYPLDTSICFDTETLEWSPVCPMDNPRYGMQTIVIKEKVYVFGGLGMHSRTYVSCDSYDTVSDSWIKLTDLPILCSNFSCLRLYGDEIVLLIGGWDPFTLEVCSTVMAYDITSNRFTVWKERLNVPRQDSVCFLHGNYLYVVGGLDSYSKKLSSCERIDLNTKKVGWKIIDSLPQGVFPATPSALLTKTPVRLMANHYELTRSQVYF